MSSLSQKKFSIDSEQIQLLESYREWGFLDQSSMVREALNRLSNDLRKNKQKDKMAKKARELVSEYNTDKEFTVFTDLDSEEFL
ncbi:conserved hypothetical protein [Desulfonatronospira thiodismutans ASO3-1]|uniref:CopG family transcriptional regulator n=1 Tax=Desulfonatronospira thiodismutans ASO3-1 TaxID=555779 RepID=D6STC5_9BACT|nr:hypothetical protein [Desulfonatronospira thiodismutans]EFI33941.1 conserved hypothetical protein [Desulfonatronospira thiodismutans ASO3-1]